MIFNSPVDAMPWVGLYIALASLICTFAMAADVTRAVWQWNLWVPNRYFTLNAVTITLIAIAMKLPMDLTTDMSRRQDQQTKMLSINFLVTMLANFLPSLGLMDDKELLMNMVALGILMITFVVNIGIQFTLSFLLQAALPLIFSILWPFSVAVTISNTRNKLEHLYKESQALISCHQGKMFSSKEHKRHVKKYWMMAETRNPQFVIACSAVSSAYGVLCSMLFVGAFFNLLVPITDYTELGTSDYKWSTKIIFLVQSFGIVVGSIAPIFRCFTSIGHYSLSKKWSKNQLNVFRVEKHWIETLQQWKRNYVHSHISGRHCKILFHYTKNAFLNFCMALHIVVLVICKTICLIPRTFLIVVSYCWYFFKSFLKRILKVKNVSTRNVTSEMEEYSRYVVQIEEEAKLSNRILRNTLRSITKLLDESEKKASPNLIKLLEKSVGFNGVVEFNNDQVPPLNPEETHNGWSLVVVTLTSIAIALPGIANDNFKGLLSSMRESLEIIRHIEDC